MVKLQQAFNFSWETGSFECREWEATLHRLAWRRPCCAFPVNPFPDTALFPLALDLARAAPVGRSAVSKPPQEAARPGCFLPQAALASQRWQREMKNPFRFLPAAVPCCTKTLTKKAALRRVVVTPP